jgi:hypothetical protein
MSPPTLVTLVWLGVAPRPSAHDTELARFAAAHHVRFQAAPNPSPALAERFPAYDPAVVEEIEALLEKARLAAGALDDAAVLAYIGSLEQRLRAHAEVPQAAWLMAERLHIEAAVLERRPAEQARARELRRAAHILEGTRAPVYRPDAGARADDGSATAPPPEPEAPPPLSVRVRVSGLRPGDVLEWNGQSTRAPARVAAGLHHVRIVRRGELALAQWLTVEAIGREQMLAAPAPAPCSASDLAPIRTTAGRVQAPHTRCRSWAVARPAGAAAIEIAWCSGARCGSWTRWPAATHGARARGPQDERTWQTWTPYVLGGIVAVAATGVVLWRVGVFDREEPEDRVIFTGPSALTF